MVERVASESILRYLSKKAAPGPLTRILHIAVEKAKGHYSNGEDLIDSEKEQ